MSRINRRLTLSENLLLVALFGGALVYAFFGALQGALYVPARGGGTYLRGIAAWFIVPVPALFWLAILVRHGLFEKVGRRTRLVLEFGALIGGLVFLFGALRQGATT